MPAKVLINLRNLRSVWPPQYTHAKPGRLKSIVTINLFYTAGDAYSRKRHNNNNNNNIQSHNIIYRLCSSVRGRRYACVDCKLTTAVYWLLFTYRGRVLIVSPSNMSIAALLQAAEYLERRERGKFTASPPYPPPPFADTAAATDGAVTADRVNTVVFFAEAEHGYASPMPTTIDLKGSSKRPKMKKSQGSRWVVVFCFDFASYKTWALNPYSVSNDDVLFYGLLGIV